MSTVGARDRIRALQLETYAVYFAVKEPQVPWFAKLAAAVAVGYQASPIQLIPNWIPLFGFADNVVVLAGAAWLVRRVTPKTVFTECQRRAQSAMLHHAQILGGIGARIALAAVLAIWFLSGVAIGLLILRAV